MLPVSIIQRMRAIQEMKRVLGDTRPHCCVPGQLLLCVMSWAFNCSSHCGAYECLYMPLVQVGHVINLLIIAGHAALDDVALLAAFTSCRYLAKA